MSQPAPPAAREPVGKSGFVVLAGRPNAGKSTLLNALVGTKLAITSPRPQTTRHLIRGVIHRPEGQAVLVDTPGLFMKVSNLLTEKVNQRLGEALEGIDLVVHVADPTRATGPEEKAIEQLILKVPKPRLLAINKMDVADKPFLDDYRALAPRYDACVELSAWTGKGVPGLADEIFKRLPTGPLYYEQFQVTDESNEQWIAEIIREKLLLQTGQELPYQCTVEIEQIADRPRRRPDEPATLYIKANILTNHERYRPMLLGQGGRKIRAIGQAARKELEVAMNKKVFLELFVQVDERWMERFE
jgi:GTP-binding protein Era